MLENSRRSAISVVSVYHATLAQRRVETVPNRLEVSICDRRKIGNTGEIAAQPMGVKRGPFYTKPGLT